MIENTNAAPEAEEIIDINISDDSQIQDSPEDELEKYTKSVSKRINKLNAKNREAEDRAKQALQTAAQQAYELQQYKQYTQQMGTTVLQKESEALDSKEAQVDEIFKKAVEANDAELMSKATGLKNELAIQREKVRVASARQESERQQYQSQYQQPAQDFQAASSQQVYNQYSEPDETGQSDEPTPEAASWHERNSWYGDESSDEHKEASQFAYYTHFNLINEGLEPDSDEYYAALDQRVSKVYPSLINAGSEDIDSSDTQSRPAVQRVASASGSGGRQQTRGKKNGVSFSKSEVERLRGLKPNDMTEEAWLQRVAKEKQKIAQREAF